MSQYSDLVTILPVPLLELSGLGVNGLGEVIALVDRSAKLPLQGRDLVTEGCLGGFGLPPTRPHG